jgi:hypothetical protein
VIVGTLLLVVVLATIAFTVPLMTVDQDEFTVSFSRGEAVIESSDGTRLNVTDGAVVRAGDRVVVEDGATVSLAASDGHAFTVTDSSVVEANGSRKTLMGNRVDTKVSVEKGNVRVSGHGRTGTSLGVGLPNGVAGVRGTEFEVQAMDSLAVVSVHEGNVVLSSIPGGNPVELGAGQGAVLSPKGPTVQALLPAPKLTQPKSDTFIRSAGKSMKWLPVDSAIGYVAEFAADPGFLEVLHSERVSTPELTLPLLEVEGRVTVRVAAMSEDGVVGTPSNGLPIQFSIHWAKALELRDQEDFEASLAEFDQAIELYPEEVWLLRDKGWTLYLASRHEEAKETYEQALLFDPSNDEVEVELARIHYRLGEFEDAVGHYQKILERSPDHAHALWGLGDTYRVQRRTREATKLVERALELEPDHPYAKDTLKKLRGGT